MRDDLLTEQLFRNRAIFTEEEFSAVEIKSLWRLPELEEVNPCARFYISEKLKTVDFIHTERKLLGYRERTSRNCNVKR